MGRKSPKRKIKTITIGFFLIFLIICSIIMYFIPQLWKNDKSTENDSVPNTSGVGVVRKLNVDPKTGEEVDVTINNVYYTQLDVGQADAGFLTIKYTILNQNYSYDVLIDSGNWQQEKTNTGLVYTPNASQHLIPYLKTQDAIDMIILTHSDADHIGGMKDIYKENLIAKDCLFVFNPDTTTNTTTLKNTLSGMANYNVLIPKFTSERTNAWDEILEQQSKFGFYLEPGLKLFDFGIENVWMKFLAPTFDYNIGSLNEPNENSLNFEFNFKETNLLLSGDSEGTTHNDLINFINKNQNEYSQKFDYYKVAHHGSVTHLTNNIDFLKSITKPTTKYLLSQNDNKKFSGVSTLTEKSIENFKTIKDFIIIDKPWIYDTQTLGDITINFINNQINYNSWRNDLFDKSQPKLIDKNLFIV